MMENTRKRTYQWTDPQAIATQAKSMSGFDFLNGVLKGTYPSAPLSVALDFHPIGLEVGKAIFEFEPQEFHFNPFGTVHGGAITSVLDTVMGCTVHSTLPQGKGFTTLELKVNFVKAVTLNSGKLIATGKIIHAGKTTALVEADLRDTEGKLYAHCISTCMIFNIEQ